MALVHATVTGLSGETLVEDRFLRGELVIAVKERLSQKYKKNFTLLQGTKKLGLSSVVSTDSVTLLAIARGPELSAMDYRAFLQALSGVSVLAELKRFVCSLSVRLLNDEVVIDTTVSVHMEMWSKFASDNQDETDFYLRRNWPLDAVKDRSEWMLSLVEKDAQQLRFASERLRDDAQVVMAAMENDYNAALEFSSSRLRDDKDVAMAAVSGGLWNLKLLSERLRDDKELVMAVVERHSWALAFASDRLRDDADVVASAVSRDARALQFASARLGQPGIL